MKYQTRNNLKERLVSFSAAIAAGLILAAFWVADRNVAMALFVIAGMIVAAIVSVDKELRRKF